MATSITTVSFPSPNDVNNSAPQIPIDPSPSVSRRLPPPCWTDDETAVLIDTYRDKWYSLRRGYLKANHWQEVADEIAVKCPVNPSKTPVQCRHKMEKLRKRYRSEIQRAAPYVGGANRRFISTWVNFNRMDSMERGPGVAEPDGKVELKLNVDIYDNIRSKFPINDNREDFRSLPMNNGGSGVRIRVPVRTAPGLVPASNIYGKYDEFGVPSANYLPSPNINLHYGGSSKGMRNEFVGRGEFGKKVRREDVKKVGPVDEMVEAIRALGEGFVKMERMKMDMAREIEEMRMEMEMKRTEMLIESQQGIVEAFAKTISETRSKKQKIVPTRDC